MPDMKLHLLTQPYREWNVTWDFEVTRVRIITEDFRDGVVCPPEQRKLVPWVVGAVGAYGFVSLERCSVLVPAAPCMFWRQV